ncbi:MAG TPA: tRNA-dihydrouridine synthase family protein, partial [Maribacter sp.]|nr:tRNA-dihydrouridine synthase family protein [Maribacter sp.]
MSVILLSSPLQGFTDFRFRNAFHKYFGGIDTFYAPYIRLNGKMVIKNSYQKDLQPENNTTLEVIPQVMTGDADEFLFVIKYIQSLGYKELNWNLGCPYPMVTKQGMGSGLICNPEKIDLILKRAHEETDVVVSMKMRMGYENAEEILAVFPILDSYPLKNIAIHARIGKQLYKGGVDLDAFQKCVESTKHKLYYNGDITTVAKFQEMQERFPSIDHFMMGRGLISDPFLPSMIKNNTTEYPK